MNVLRLALVFTVGLSLVSGLAHAADTINWLTSVPEGTFSDAANWTGGVIPTNNTIGTFSGNQTYTIHFPAGGYAENSATKVNLSSSRSLTFDTRGTWWLKDAPTITNGWPTSWTGFTIANSSGSHLFNIEGLLTSAAATNYPVMCLSNAVYRYYSSATVTNVLEEGLLNLYDPKGITYSSLSLITGSAGTRHVAIFKTNSTLRATQIRMRGNAYGNYMIFEGGDHAIYNGLCVGEGATNAGYTNTVQVTGGTLSLPASYLYIGYGKTNSCGEFSVSGDGVVTVGNQIAMANYQGQSLASLKLSDRGVLRAGTYLDAAYNTSSTATISLANSALLSVGSNLAVARGNSSFSTLDLRDQSVCTAGGYLLIAVPGLKKDIHDDIPEEMLRSWRPEDIDTLHDADYWRRIIAAAQGAEIVHLSQIEGFDECWSDWLACDNEYAIKDRAAMEAGAGRYMNLIAMILRRI